MENIEVDFVAMNKEEEFTEEGYDILEYDISENGYLDEVLFKKSFEVLRELVQEALREIEKVERAFCKSISILDPLYDIEHMSKDDIRKIEIWMYDVKKDMYNGKNLLSRHAPAITLLLGIKKQLYDDIASANAEDLSCKLTSRFTKYLEAE